MQDYISDPKNKLKIDRIKLALTHLEASDIAKEEIEIDTLCGYVEPFYGLGNYHTWGDLGWLQDWYIRPVFNKKAKSLLDYSSIRQSRTFKYRRRGSLGKLYTAQLDRDYALFDPPIFSHIESKGWRDYIWTYLLLRRRERLFGYPDVITPSDKDVEDLLIQASKFTITKPTGVLSRHTNL